MLCFLRRHCEERSDVAIQFGYSPLKLCSGLPRRYAPRNEAVGKTAFQSNLGNISHAV